MRKKQTEFEKKFIDLVRNEHVYRRQAEVARYKYERGDITSDVKERIEEKEQALLELANIDSFLSPLEKVVVLELAKSSYREKNGTVVRLSRENYLCRTSIYNCYRRGIQILEQVMNL